MTEREKFLKIKKKQVKKDRKKFKKLLRIGEQIANAIMNDSLYYNRELNKIINSNEITGDSLKLIPKEEVYKEKRALKLIEIYLEDNLIPSEQSL